MPDYLYGRHAVLEALRAGRPIEQIERDTDRDFFMTAEDAKAYGLVDEVYERKVR